MIICSLPRCGTTKFCLDLEEKTGLKFVGELNPMHINNESKALLHETKFQPNYTPKMFADILHNSDKYIVMVNQYSYLMLPQCDIVILRKNMQNAFLSMSNFLLKLFPGIKTAALIHQLRLMNNDLLAMNTYLDVYKKKIIWYEEYFGDLKTKTPLLDSYIGRDLITREIASYNV